MTQYHHRAAKEVAKSLLKNWRSGHWANEFVSNDVFLTGSTSIHPSPDADFQDENKKTKISSNNVAKLGHKTSIQIGNRPIFKEVLNS